MDITQVQNLAGWVIGTLIAGILLAAANLIAVIKSGKMLPKDLRGADLNNAEKEKHIVGEELANQSKELEIINNLKGMVSQGVQDALNLNKRLLDLETRVQSQEDIINSQAGIIEQQTLRIDEQDRKILQQNIKIQEQEDEIAILRCELINANSYNAGLKEQMRNNSITPIDDLITKKEDCSKLKDRLKATRKRANDK